MRTRTTDRDNKPLPEAMVSASSAVAVKITDVTLRDGQQSLIATRMRTDDMLTVVAEMGKVGFHSMEVWGGATFDVAVRFLNEDPWDRPRVLKRLLPNMPLQMLVRGQNLVGYRHYADDVVAAFIRHAFKAGIEIFRVFDALNDERNLEACLKAIKEYGGHAQLAICYTLTEPKMGGPIFNLDYYVNKARILQDMGADSVCIKDMAGLLAPDDAFTLVTALKRMLHVPLQLHTHYSSGMATATCLKAIEAGVDMVDTGLAPFALRSGPPALEPIVAALKRMPRDTGIDLAQVLKLDLAIEGIADKYRDLLDNKRLSPIDTGVLVHQIPGGMISNLLSQLKQANALNRLAEVEDEIPRVRRELGYPPLVTPTSQILGVQAFYNVVFGRYKQLTTQLIDYCLGLYGKPPAPIDPEVMQTILRRQKREPTTLRPADLLPPEMETARETIKSLSRDTGDALTCALYPQTGLAYLKKKYGVAG